MTASRPESVRRCAVTGVATLCAMVVLVAATAIAELPSNVLAPRASSATGWLRGAVPQGWSFFTRDARERTLSGWVERAGSWRPVAPVAGASPRFALGANRGARLLDADLAYVAQAAGSDWHDCGSGDPSRCLAEAATVQTPAPVRVRAVVRDLCGSTIGVVRSDPIPWAFGALTRRHLTAVQVVAVDCLPEGT